MNIIINLQKIPFQQKKKLIRGHISQAMECLLVISSNDNINEDIK